MRLTNRKVFEYAVDLTFDQQKSTIIFAVEMLLSISYILDNHLAQGVTFWLIILHTFLSVKKGTKENNAISEKGKEATNDNFNGCYCILTFYATALANPFSDV